jgi:hypothetical protein
VRLHDHLQLIGVCSIELVSWSVCSTLFFFVSFSGSNLVLTISQREQTKTLSFRSTTRIPKSVNRTQTLKNAIKLLETKPPSVVVWLDGVDVTSPPLKILPRKRLTAFDKVFARRLWELPNQHNVGNRDIYIVLLWQLPQSPCKYLVDCRRSLPWQYLQGR